MQDTTDTGCELDERKRESTLGLHGINHHDAVGVFDGRPVVRGPSCHPDEEHRAAAGKLSRQMVKPVRHAGADMRGRRYPDLRFPQGAEE